MAEYKLPVESSFAGVSAAARRAMQAHASVTVKVAGAVLATALAAQVKVWAPPGPVPITLQTLVVLLTGFALGGRLAPVAMTLYVGLGAVGLPMFAVGLVGPTGGYLVGFVLAAAFVGRYRRVGRGGWLPTAGVATVGSAIVFGLGLLWLTAWLGGDVAAALRRGLLPFWPGEVLKTAMAVAAVQGWRYALAGLRDR